MNVVKIMLDAGHGYNTPGKRTPDGMREFEFNSVVAAYAKKFLEGYQNVTVYFAHDASGKRDVPLQERTDNANRLKVNVYVSVHANAYGQGWNTANGIETYVHPIIPAETRAIATKIHNQLISKTRMTNRGVKNANFHVLRETDMNAVLVECGFMTNQSDASKLKSDAYRKLCAEAIVAGLVEYYKLVKKVIPKPIPAPQPKPTGVKVDGKVHRILVDGKQIGAYDNAVSIGEFAELHASKGAKKIEIVLV